MLAPIGVRIHDNTARMVPSHRNSRAIRESM